MRQSQGICKGVMGDEGWGAWMDMPHGIIETDNGRMGGMNR